MKVSEELLSSWATSCLLSYRMNGLSETLNLLKSLCAEFTHVDRINVAYIPADFSAIASLLPFPATVFFWRASARRTVM